MRWIQLSKRKPKHDTKCLIFAESADINCPLYQVAWWNEKTKRFDGLIEYWQMYVTHWSYLTPPTTREVVKHATRNLRSKQVKEAKDKGHTKGQVK